jgi:signal peptidase II
MSILYIIIGVIWFIVDYVTKYFIQQHFVPGESLPIIPNVFHITYILNYGAAFGILRDQRIFFLTVVVILIVALWVFRKQIKNGGMLPQLGASLLVSGALGNALDRLVRGAVVDFFDFRIWPIFNVADIGICIGVVLLAIYFWRYDSKK